MNATELDTAINNRAMVRITNRSGHAKGLSGIALGYNRFYHTVKVGFVDDNGNYTGDYTKVSADCIEIIEEQNADVPAENNPAQPSTTRKNRRAATRKASQILKTRTRTQRAASRIARRGTATLATHAIATGLTHKEATSVAGSLRKAATKLHITGTPARIHAGRHMRDARLYTPAEVAAMCGIYRPRKGAYRVAAAKLALAA